MGTFQAGVVSFERTGQAPVELIDSIRRTKVALKGPVTTPIGTGFASVNVGLRKALDLYANLRPVQNLPGVVSRFDGVDLVIVRENTEDLYAGLEHEVVPGVVESLKIIARVDVSPSSPSRAASRAQESDRHSQKQHHEAQRRVTYRRAVPASRPPDERIVDATCAAGAQARTSECCSLLHGDIVGSLRRPRRRTERRANLGLEIAFGPSWQRARYRRKDARESRRSCVRCADAQASRRRHRGRSRHARHPSGPRRRPRANPRSRGHRVDDGIRGCDLSRARAVSPRSG